MNELVLSNNTQTFQQKEFLDELILILVRQFRLSYYFIHESRLSVSIFYLHNFLKDSLRVHKEFKNPPLNEFVNLSGKKKHKEYEIVLETLLLLEKIFEKKIILSYSKHVLFDAPFLSPNDRSPILFSDDSIDKSVIQLTSMVNESSIEGMIKEESPGRKLAVFNLDSSVISYFPFSNPPEVQNSINVFNALNSKYSLHASIEEVDITKLFDYLISYLCDFASQKLQGIQGINNLKMHTLLFKKSVLNELGVEKSFIGSEIIVSRSLFAYYATMMDGEKCRDYEQYKMIEFLMYLEMNSKIEIIFLDKFDTITPTLYGIKSEDMSKHALKIDGMDWFAKIKLLASPEEIKDFLFPNSSNNADVNNDNSAEVGEVYRYGLLELNINKRYFKCNNKEQKDIKPTNKEYELVKNLIIRQKREPNKPVRYIDLAKDLGGFVEGMSNVKAGEFINNGAKRELFKVLDKMGFEKDFIKSEIIKTSDGEGLEIIKRDT